MISREILRLREDSLRIFRAALNAADAGAACHKSLQSIPLTLADFHHVTLVTVGKAASAMASAIKQTIPVHRCLAVTKYRHGSPPGDCTFFEAGHPLPDRAGEIAAKAVEDLVRDVGPRDLLIVAVSGGASALLPAPVRGVSLADKQRTTDLLLRAGANIRELNTVRKHLSRLKGGRLAASAYPATVLGLLLSDVIGDDIATIGSGLTAGDETSFGDAVGILEQFNLLDRVPASVRAYLVEGAAGLREDTPKPGNYRLSKVTNVIVGSNRIALASAAAEAEALGYGVIVSEHPLHGEARAAAAQFVSTCERIANSDAPLCILAGGETTVEVKGQGMGGRNQEFALAAALRLEGKLNFVLLSAGTDGTDGPTDAAGAWADSNTVSRARTMDLDAQVYLAENNSYAFFDALGDLLRTGPTGTNVMDICMYLSTPAQKS